MLLHLNNTLFARVMALARGTALCRSSLRTPRLTLRRLYQSSSNRGRPPDSNRDDEFLFSYTSSPRSSPSYPAFLLRFSAVAAGLGTALFYGSSALVSLADSSPAIDRVLKSSEAPVTVALVSANVALFALKRSVPALTPLLVRYGYLRLDILQQTHRVSTPLSPALSILVSAFSHRNAMHLFFNCYAMYSFGSFIERLDGYPNLLAVYAICVPFSAIGSLILKGVAVPSIGASGACMGMLAYTAVRRPSMEISIIGLPMFKLSIDTGLLLIAGFSAIGAARSVFLKRASGGLDHGGHLGGLLGGYLAAQSVQNAINKSRARLGWIS